MPTTERKPYRAILPPAADPTGKLPPHDTDLEEVVLGACMLEKDAYMNVCDVLVPESF